MPLPSHFVITVGRSFGSGGRELGRLIAERLGIPFYDNQLLVKAAEASGLNLSYTEEHDERAPHNYTGILPFAMGYYPTSWFGPGPSSAQDYIYAAQCETMRELARTSPCVIVGRTADYVLEGLVPTFNLFVHAPLEACVARTLARGEAEDHDKAVALIARTNKLRSSFYNFYTDKEWGRADGYHLSLDSSMMPLEELANFAVNIITAKLELK